MICNPTVINYTFTQYAGWATSKIVYTYHLMRCFHCSHAGMCLGCQIGIKISKYSFSILHLPPHGPVVNPQQHTDYSLTTTSLRNARSYVTQKILEYCSVMCNRQFKQFCSNVTDNFLAFRSQSALVNFAGKQSGNIT